MVNGCFLHKGALCFMFLFLHHSALFGLFAGVCFSSYFLCIVSWEHFHHLNGDCAQAEWTCTHQEASKEEQPTQPHQLRGWVAETKQASVDPVLLLLNEFWSRFLFVHFWAGSTAIPVPLTQRSSLEIFDCFYIVCPKHGQTQFWGAKMTLVISARHLCRGYSCSLCWLENCLACTTVHMRTDFYFCSWGRLRGEWAFKFGMLELPRSDAIAVGVFDIHVCFCGRAILSFRSHLKFCMPGIFLKTIESGVGRTWWEQKEAW